MSQSTDKEKIERIKNLYNKFHSKMLVLLKKQSKLFEKSIEIANEKNLEEIRSKIKKN